MLKERCSHSVGCCYGLLGIVFLFGEVNPAWVQCLPWSLNSLLLPAMLPKFQQSERTELFCPISQRKPRLVVASSLLLLGLPWLLAPKES